MSSLEGGGRGAGKVKSVRKYGSLRSGFGSDEIGFGLLIESEGLEPLLEIMEAFLTRSRNESFRGGKEMGAGSGVTRVCM